MNPVYLLLRYVDIYPRSCGCRFIAVDVKVPRSSSAYIDVHDAFRTNSLGEDYADV